MRRRNKTRPELRLELGGLGTVDPFVLDVVESPPGSGEYFVTSPDGPARAGAEIAGLSLVGASQALMALSFKWMQRTGHAPAPALTDQGEPPPTFGEVRLVVRRREARLLGKLLRAHTRRVEAPPDWQVELLSSLEQIDEFMRWEDPSGAGS